MNTFDESLVIFLNGAGIPDDLVIFFGVYLPFIVGVVLLGFFVVSWIPDFVNSPKRVRAVIIDAAIAGGVARFVVAEVVRFLWNRARPFEVLPAVHQGIAHLPGDSFPSGHAVFFFALAETVRQFYPTAGYGLYGAAIFISLGRVTGGIHWPTDILGGILIGVFIGWIAAFLAKKYGSSMFRQSFMNIPL